MASSHSVMSRIDFAVQAGFRAAKNNKSNATQIDQHQKSIEAQDRQTDAINKQSAGFDNFSNKMSDQLMPKGNDGGGEAKPANKEGK